MENQLINKNVLIDFQNLAFRIFFSVKEIDEETRKQYIYTGICTSLLKLYNRFSPCNLVMFFDGLKSWRKFISSDYKANRVLMFAEKKDDMELIFGIISEFKELFNNTNCRVYTTDNAESDDLITLFTELHNDEQNIIISTDTDFYQLITDNISVYNPNTEYLITKQAVFNKLNESVNFNLDGNGKLCIEKDKGILVSEVDNWPEFTLFCKIIRGDTSDNIFPAYPGVRVKGTKKSTGILAAFKDRHNKGFDYVNFMNQEWEDREGKKRIVNEEFKKNETLINLKCIPDEWKQIFIDYIKTTDDNFTRKQLIGIKLSQFANKHNIEVMLENNVLYSEMLNK